jgi:RNA polymerase sigma factor (TIGR02999 family)
VGHESAGQITRLLQGWRGGDRKALDALLPVVYNELQRLAHFQLRKERPDHTLQSAALVNEAYLRLVGLNAPQWEGRSHFFAIAAQHMRQILVDYARRHRAAKRGGVPQPYRWTTVGCSSRERAEIWTSSLLMMRSRRWRRSTPARRRSWSCDSSVD